MTERNTESEAEPQPFIGFSQFVMNHPFRIANVETIKEAARRAGARIVVTDAEGSAEVEAQNVQWMLDQGVDAVIISSLSGAESHEMYRRVAETGTPLIIFASGLPSDEYDVPYTTYVGSNEKWVGAQAAEYIGKRLGVSGGKIVVLYGPMESSNARLRGSGFKLELERSYPQVEITGHLTGDWLRDSAFELMTQYLTQHPHVDAVFAENDEMALGAMDALVRWDPHASTFIVGVDGQQAALCEIWSGGPFAMTVRTEFDGDAAVHAAIDALRGRDVPSRIELAASVITVKNIDQFLHQRRTTW
ncbi:substrate-binding domain-containing protein [Mycetocola miduiensis]|uniref:Monosaccharide ABC transporter substrate-binding protein, CUT2 family n=1 Tax=Mycetocola miduiensis TaxID=995034 RepID=A0A1I5AFK4_9MICO|nr:substrate-binding domain-containing protein [Mycetocola miduiensis]SFN61227.1 monosaccharide ABC transporter substrate-binding protein, CUT2 family [Mycetocola miduiensis]